MNLFFASRNHEEAKRRNQNCTKGSGTKKKTAETFNFILLKFVRRFDINSFCNQDLFATILLLLFFVFDRSTTQLNQVLKKNHHGGAGGEC